MNLRQLVLKVSANSVYGYTGQTVSKLALVDIAKTITTVGRNSIALAKETVENYFKNRTDGIDDVTVIYGDTDSIMINFHHSPDMDGIRKTFDEAKLGAKLINLKMKAPMSIEFEKG